MLDINIVCVGKLKEKYWSEACAEYAKRMKAFCRFGIVEVEEERLPDDPSQAQISQTLVREGHRILSRIGRGTRIIALCIEGKMYTSEELAKELEKTALDGCSSIALVIGGSWGLSDEVKNAAAIKLSMSRMTFPHQLARVMLCEQLYRSFQIQSGGKYHK